MNLKKGDTVVVISGSYKDKQGTVLKVLPKSGKVVVEGVNVVSRHTRPSQANPDGGIIKKEETYVFQTAVVVEKNEMTNSFVREFCLNLKKNCSCVAKKIPVIPDVVEVEDIAGELKGLKQVPLGVAGDDFNCLYHDFTKNCVLQILSHDLDDTAYFAQGIYEV